MGVGGRSKTLWTNKKGGGLVKCPCYLISSFTEFQNFFTFWGSLVVFYFMISIFLSFEIIMAKKAALVAGAAFLHLWKFMVSKLLL